MEMKKLYPKLPTAPSIEDQGQGYRLQKINEIQAFLEREIEERGKLSKTYFRAAKIRLKMKYLKAHPAYGN